MEKDEDYIRTVVQLGAAIENLVKQVQHDLVNLACYVHVNHVTECSEHLCLFELLVSIVLCFAVGCEHIQKTKQRTKSTHLPSAMLLLLTHQHAV